MSKIFVQCKKENKNCSKFCLKKIIDENENFGDFFSGISDKKFFDIYKTIFWTISSQFKIDWMSAQFKFLKIKYFFR